MDGMNQMWATLENLYTKIRGFGAARPSTDSNPVVSTNKISDEDLNSGYSQFDHEFNGTFGDEFDNDLEGAKACALGKLFAGEVITWSQGHSFGIHYKDNKPLPGSEFTFDTYSVYSKRVTNDYVFTRKEFPYMKKFSSLYQIKQFIFDVLKQQCSKVWVKFDEESLAAYVYVGPVTRYLDTGWPIDEDVQTGINKRLEEYMACH
jgi:hypothetical protein